MPTRNIVLTPPHQASFVEQLVSSGRCQNASEVLREGLRLVEQREAEGASRLDALRNAVQVGVADFDAGRFTTFESLDVLGAYLSQVCGSQGYCRHLSEAWVVRLSRHAQVSRAERAET